MFIIEAEVRNYCNKHCKKEAIELAVDRNEYTELYTPSEPFLLNSPVAGLKYNRSLLDYNEHFIEMSNYGEEKRSLMLAIAILFLAMVAVSLYGVVLISKGASFDVLTLLAWSISAGAMVLVHHIWRTIGSAIFFTFLRARYRFNRTTGKVYVLRPSRFGGNAVLDWKRVQAHVMWRGWTRMKYAQLHDLAVRVKRNKDLSFANVVLYWPSLDSNDPSRNGEDVLWIGPYLSDNAHWQYLCKFMEEGIDAVPVPNEYERIRKGYSTPGQNLHEVAMHPFRVDDLRAGHINPSGSTYVGFFVQFLWTPLHSLAERLCTWPTFPEEWNSDCGQKRRESGIGPEEPLRWEAR